MALTKIEHLTFKQGISKTCYAYIDLDKIVSIYTTDVDWLNEHNVFSMRLLGNLDLTITTKEAERIISMSTGYPCETI